MVQFQLSAFKKQIKNKNIPNKLEIIFFERNRNHYSYFMFRELKENHSNFFNISRKQYSKVKKNSVSERFNIYSGETLDIIEKNFTVDIDDIIVWILELTKSKKISIFIEPV